MFLLSATLMLITPLAQAAGKPGVAQVSAILAGAVAIPLGLLHVIEPQRARGLQFELTTSDQRRPLL